MKQHITVSDLQTLSTHALDKYDSWCEEKKYFTRTDGVCTYDLLNIGQMMEFLSETNMQKKITSPQGGSLCDSLWGLVKEILEST